MGIGGKLSHLGRSWENVQVICLTESRGLASRAIPPTIKARSLVILLKDLNLPSAKFKK